MGFGGAIDAMIASSKSNRALRKNHRKDWKKVSDQYHYHSKKEFQIPKNKWSAAEMEAFKTRIRLDAERERKRKVLVYSVVSVVVLVLGYYLLFRI